MELSQLPFFGVVASFHHAFLHHRGTRPKHRICLLLPQLSNSLPTPFPTPPWMLLTAPLLMPSFQGKQTRRRKREIENAPKTFEAGKLRVKNWDIHRFARMVWWGHTRPSSMTEDRGLAGRHHSLFLYSASLFFFLQPRTRPPFSLLPTRSLPTFRFLHNYLSSLQGPIGRGHPHHGNRIPGTPLHGHALEHERTS